MASNSLCISTEVLANPGRGSANRHPLGWENGYPYFDGDALNQAQEEMEKEWAAWPAILAAAIEALAADDAIENRLGG